MKSKRKVILVSLFLLVLAGFIVAFKFIMNKQSEDMVYSGTIEADEINISSEASGKLNNIKISEGQKIKVGDLIATINSDESSVKLKMAETSVANAENELSKVTAGNRSEQIKQQEAVVKQVEAQVKQAQAAVEQAKANITQYQSNYDYKEKIYKDNETLYNSGSVSKYDLDSSKNAADNASTQLKAGQSQLDASQAQLEQFKAQLDAANQQLNLLVDGATEQSVTTGKYGIDTAQQNYNLSQLQADKNNIVSSSDGTIETVNFKAGEYVAPGSPIATMLDLNNMYVKIYVPESILPKLKVDKEVTMKSDFIKNKSIKGKITYISPEAEFTPMNVVTKKDRMKLVFEVKVAVLDNKDLVKSGMLMDVDLK